MRYRVNRLLSPLTIDGNWDKPAWQNAEPLELACHMGRAPEHRPRVQAKLLYDREYVYVIWRVEDRYVRAAARKCHDAVSQDSCVEFFFVPGDDVTGGYFKLEMNCGGTMLFAHHRVPRVNGRLVDPADCQGIEVYHSMPAGVDPEIGEPVTWRLEYRLSVDLLAKYAAVHRPAPGTVWRANFYKCADGTSHPHWLTWAPIDHPEPDFHRPDFFGTLEFT